MTLPDALIRAIAGESFLMLVSGMMKEVPEASTAPPSSAITTPLCAVAVNRLSIRLA